MRNRARLFDEEEASRDGFLLRRMHLDELAEVTALEHRAFAHPWSPELLRRELTHDWSTILLALEPREDGEPVIVGFVIFWVVVDEIHILNVAVDPPQRRRGIARMLLEELLDRGQKAGLVVATLEVRRSNEGAIALYQGLGFRVVGIRKGYYAEEREDAIVMVRDLA
ncbi:ribosomal protein S18-alanine N-acetyltransferase [Vulgatibacter incomptus]|uniref:Ribosomal-protein-S18p-alanine acetyltransferase n=1 Tax=Vulgatibacter incomptus TaxID=1391653 RepID=A0A0K1P8U8_9BACT|nr:ribosomal protein S18-alanine N-acetyltransferase [Vulgatibacter incomptus]AKU89932.1 Ribosomal-protein-S18p-alanine acetyltransferase [Vulgatibacter incomptus]